MAMSSRPSPSLPQQPQLVQMFDLEVTIVSGKHLKNVNWKNGDLKPYAIFWVDPDNKLTTKSDDSGSTKPVWNQRFLISITTPLSDSSFNLEVFHSKASEAPKPFVGSLQVNLSDLPDPNNQSLIRPYDLLRPSGRPQGKIRLKLSLKERPLPPPPLPDYQNTPPSAYYYSSAPPYPFYPPNSRPAQSQAPQLPPQTAMAYPHSAGYYSGYYAPPPLPRSFSDRFSVPSAPVEYSQPRLGGSGLGLGLGTGIAVGAVAGALGGLALDEGLKYEEGKAEDSLGARDDLSDYRADY